MSLVSIQNAALAHLSRDPDRASYVSTPSRTRLLSSWDYVDALGRTSRRWLAITRDNSIWRPVVHELYGWTKVPMARRPWMRQLLMAGPPGAEEGNGKWARLFRRLARTTFCLEPGGFRQRWDEDFWITIDIRDTEKVRA